MRIIEQLVYKITGDNSEFDRSIDKSETKVSKFGSVADKMLAGVTVAAIGMVIKKAGDMVVAVAGATDRVDKMSQKIGISRKAFQEWDFILSQSGTSVDGLQMAVKTLSGAADEASKGTLQYKESFDRLGVSVTDINGNMKDQETLFNEVFVALSNLDNQTERTAIANDLLGRSATELAPAFNAGGDAIEGMRTQAHELGLVMDDELIDNGVVLTDNIDKLKRAYQGWKNEALEPLLGLAVTFTDRMLGQNTGTKNLDDSTRSLVTQSKAYKDILTQLKDPTVVLTDAERARLEILKGIQAQNLEDTIYQTNRAYKEGIADVREAEQTLADLEATQAAYTLVTKDQSEAIKRRDELRRTKNRTDAETLELSKLNIALMATEFQRQTELLTLGDRIGEQKEKANALSGATAESVRAVAAAVEAETLSISQYALTSPDFYNAVMDQVNAIQLRKKGLEEAEKRLEDMNLTTERAIQRQIDYYESIKDGYKDELNTAMISSLLNNLYAKKNELLAEEAQKTEDANAKAQARNEILENMEDALKSAEQYSLALGDSYDLNSQKASVLESAIKALIDSGLTAEDKAVADLVAQLNSLTPATEEVVADVEDITEATEENTNVITDAQKAFNDYKTVIDNLGASLKQAEELEKLYGEQFDLNAEKATLLKGAIDSLIKLGFEASSEEVQNLVKQLEELGVKLDEVATPALKSFGDTMEEIGTTGFNSFLSGFEDIGKAIGEGSNVWKAFEAAGLNAIASVVEALGHELAARAVIHALALDWTGFGLATAGSVAAYTAAGVLRANIPSYDVGSIRIPETQTATVHKDEMILTAPQAEQARREGITIAPNKASGNSVNLVIYLDGKEIARNTIDNLNSGSVGTIKARVVK